MQQVQVIPISKIIPNPDNPRIVKDAKFEKLVQSLNDFPEMLEKRPLICVTTASGKFMVLGGNQRLKAAQKAGIKQIPVMLADEWSEEKRKEFIVKDNIGFGEWSWEVLANEWDEGKLIEWGLELPAWVHGGDDVNIDDFFDVDAEKQEGGKIVLNYNDADYRAVIDAFGKHQGTKEEIIFNLLVC